MKDPPLQKSVDIVHTFTDETRKKLRIGASGFLLSKEENQFREILEQDGKAFAFSPREIGCINPKLVESMVIFTIDHVPWNLKRIPVP